ncbi:membrane protein [Sphaerisporangium melleum]|uniref:Membrane protein n=1 Tax=Sphaerisporangium melleum TaxID=321316 RepID=A0A917R640_9ACTN|nr:DUF4383 domain-containing protein [Sphaerisporangium melleum]GGK90610.1 membrane protein [Sphaerisporangium melleum]GII72839.1 membrane protein [Sphaerisporangium melleum]
MSAHTHQMTRTPLQTAAFVLGIIFLVVGVLGFVPGITTGYGAMKFAGHTSGAHLFGLFQVSVLHNLVHLAYGVAGLAMARTWEGARKYLVWGGVIYLLLWIYGLIVTGPHAANFVPLNTADNWLHFLLGIIMIGLGVAFSRRGAPRRPFAT